MSGGIPPNPKQALQNKNFTIKVFKIYRLEVRNYLSSPLLVRQLRLQPAHDSVMSDCYLAWLQRKIVVQRNPKDTKRFQVNVINRELK